MNPKNPTSREKQEHEDSGHVVHRSWCAACVESRGVGGQHRIQLLEEEERERTTPIVAFDYGFLTQEIADTLPILICREQVWSNGSDMLRTERSHSILHFIFHQRSWFSKNHFEMRYEPSTKALQDAVIHACVGVEMIRKDHLRVITWPTVVWKWL